jgi:hypothetical protein
MMEAARTSEDKSELISLSLDLYYRPVSLGEGGHIKKRRKENFSWKRKSPLEKRDRKWEYDIKRNLNGTVYGAACRITERCGRVVR